MHPEATRQRLAARAWLVAWVLALAWLCSLLARLALRDSLTSIADDSSNYLVMARHLSPWVEESSAIRSVWPQQYFPPLFPLLLALSGAAHSLLVAHGLVLVLGLCCLPLLHRLLVRGMGLENGTAHAVTLLCALLPGFALGLQGVLSESLFLFLSLVFLLVAGRVPAPVCAVLLAAAMATRSAGLVLLAAFVVHSLCAALDRRTALRALATAALAGALYTLLLRSVAPGHDGEYARNWRSVIDQNTSQQAAFVLAQLRGLLESWCSYFTLYWRADRPATLVIAGAVLVLALGGLLARLRSNRLDAWYVALSIGMLIVWPYPGQMMRLMFPVVPLLLGHAAWAAFRLLAGRRTGPRILAVCALLVAAIVLPPHAFLHGRITLAQELGQVPVYEWLRKPERSEARRELGLQNQMLRDFAVLPAELEPQTWLACYEPSYVALLAGRPCEALGYPPDLDAVRARGRARYVLLTAIHPRQSRSTIDGLMLHGGEPVHVLKCTTEPLDGRPASCLLRLE